MARFLKRRIYIICILIMIIIQNFTIISSFAEMSIGAVDDGENSPKTSYQFEQDSSFSKQSVSKESVTENYSNDKLNVEVDSNNDGDRRIYVNPNNNILGNTSKSKSNRPGLSQPDNSSKLMGQLGSTTISESDSNDSIQSKSKVDAKPDIISKTNEKASLQVGFGESTEESEDQSAAQKYFLYSMIPIFTMSGFMAVKKLITSRRSNKNSFSFFSDIPNDLGNDPFGNIFEFNGDSKK